ncbi:hypothetical protein TNCV_807251 [Trichonephila clavipes]|nr:hypothetical protein TNCV_807251 [Trichonephila clavipes]
MNFSHLPVFMTPRYRTYVLIDEKLNQIQFESIDIDIYKTSLLRIKSFVNLKIKDNPHKSTKAPVLRVGRLEKDFMFLQDGIIFALPTVAWKHISQPLHACSNPHANLHKRNLIPTFPFV